MRQSNAGGRQGDFTGGDFELNAVFRIDPRAFDADFVVHFESGEGACHCKVDTFSRDGIEDGEGVFLVDVSDARNFSGCLDGFTDFLFKGGQVRHDGIDLVRGTAVSCAARMRESATGAERLTCFDIRAAKRRQCITKCVNRV